MFCTSKKHLKFIIDKHQIISFDIFDTLIVRLVNHPSQIFDIVEYNYNKQHEYKIVNFRENRIFYERKLKAHEPNLEQIYLELQEKYPKDVCEWLKNEEIRLENKYCIVNNTIKEFFDYAIENKKHVVAVSDMYLPQNVLESILNNNGYGAIDKLIVSNEYGVTKSSSKLFSYLDIDPKLNKVLHIGDSLKADFLGAKKFGFNAFKISKTHYKESNDNLASVIRYRDHINDSKSYFYGLGYEILGPVLLSYCRWLNEQLQSNRLNKVFFFSREGKIFKTAFETYVGESQCFKYLNISRKVITLANFNDENISSITDLLKYFTIKKNSTLVDVCQYLGIEINGFEELSNHRVYDLTENRALFEALYKAISLQSLNSRDIALAYFKQEGLEGRFAIVDIGWNGTMQTCLEKFLRNNKIDFELKSYYFSTFKDINNSQAFIDNQTELGQVIRDNPVLIENLFQALEGSTIGYQRKHHVIVPLKKEIEFNEFSQRAITDIDTGIIDFILAWKKYGFVKNEEQFDEGVRKRFYSFIARPSLESIKFFREFNYSDIKKNEPIIYSGYNLKLGLESSAWKYAYLKSLFRINLNYRSMFNYLKKFKK